jgi:RNA polymerase sigma-70 factor (ECF subfamily)
LISFERRTGLRVLQVGVVRAEARTAAIRLLEGTGESDGARWFRELYQRHSDDVRDTIALHGGPRVDAEDLVQEVFLAVHRKRDLLRQYREPGGWLHLAALRVVWKERRRARVLRALTLGILSFADDLQQPDAIFERREATQWIYAILERLPERQRQALLLSQVDGLTSVEIGRLVGCPEQTVRSRLFHARRFIAKALARRAKAEKRRERGER